VTDSPSRSTLVAPGSKENPASAYSDFILPGAQAELEPPVGQEIDGRSFACHQHGMAKVVAKYVRTYPKGLCRLRGADQRWHRRDEVGKVIGDSQSGEAECLNLPGLLHPFGP
jgi:hypothetical protein